VARDPDAADKSINARREFRCESFPNIPLGMCRARVQRACNPISALGQRGKKKKKTR
jgi:hypothetical protein